jgi:head-tail adaptor
MANTVRMRPGLRDRIITIQQRSSTDAVGSSGVPVETWTTLVSAMPASREELSGGERLMTAQMSAKAEVKFGINYRLDMDPEILDVPSARRLLHNDRVHDITYARVVGRREGIELFALAKVG